MVLLNSKDYFNQIANSYLKNNLSMISLLEKIKRATRDYVVGDILVIGSGGIINFDTTKARSIMLTDIALELLKNPMVVGREKFITMDQRLKKITKIKVVDAINLPFKDNSFDTVVMVNVIHHLSFSTIRKSKNNVQQALGEIRRVLHNDGYLLLNENCPTLIFSILQQMGYRIGYYLLSKINKPLPYFLSQKTLVKFLKEKSFKLIKQQYIPMTGRAYQPLFPALSPPGWFWEWFLTNRFFVAQKKV